MTAVDLVSAVKVHLHRRPTGVDSINNIASGIRKGLSKQASIPGGSNAMAIESVVHVVLKQWSRLYPATVKQLSGSEEDCGAIRWELVDRHHCWGGSEFDELGLALERHDDDMKGMGRRAKRIVSGYNEKSGMMSIESSDDEDDGTRVGFNKNAEEFIMRSKLNLES